MPDTARWREKQHAAYAVRSGTAVWHPPSPAELAAIDHPAGSNAVFGIRRLSKLELNAPLSALDAGTESTSAALAEISTNRAG